MPETREKNSLIPHPATVLGNSDPTGDEWPMFHGALNHSGFTTTTPIYGKVPLWTCPTGDLIDSSPAVTGGWVYIGIYDHTVYCLNATTGAINWTCTIGDFTSSSPAIAGGRVYIGCYDGKLYCLNATTGAINWTRSTLGPIYSSPAISGGRVYFGSYDNKVYCLNATTGVINWTRPTANYVYSSPAIAGGRLYVGCWDHKIYCLNATTGAINWTYTTGGIVRSSPAVVDGRVYIGCNDHKVYCLDATTGVSIWNGTTGDSVWSCPAVTGGRVYVGSLDFKIYCFNAATGGVLWTRPTGDAVYSSPSVACGWVYVGSDDTKLYCLNAITGAINWTYTTGNLVSSSPAIAGGRIYVGSMDNNVYCLPMMPATVPGAPQNLNVISGNRQLTLTWQPPSNIGGSPVTGYRVYIGTTSGGEVLNATLGVTLTYTVTNLKNGVWYYFQVSAINDVGEGGKSSEASVIPAIFTLSSDAGSPDLDGKFTLSWTTASGAINYTIYTHPSYISTINDSLIPAVASGLTGLNYFVQSVTNGTRYYIVVAFNATGNYSSNCIRITVQLMPPGTFTLSSDAGLPDADGKFTLSWTVASSAINYTIYTYPTFINKINNSLVVVDFGLTNSSRLVQGLVNGTYYYIAVAFNTHSNRSSNCIRITVLVQPPGPFTLSSNAGNPDTDGRFTLTWTSSNFAQYYNVYTCSNPITKINGSVAWIALGTTNLSYDVQVATNGTRYYAVVAFNPSSNKTSNCFAVIVDIHMPGPFILMTTAGNPDTDGQFALNWTISSNADNYSLYYFTRFITSINNTVYLVIGGLTNQSLLVSRVPSGVHYFIIVAMNENGNTISNCILVTVQLPTPGSFTLSSNAGNPDDDGRFTLSWTASTSASNYSICMFSRPITTINASIHLLVAGATNLSMFVSGLENGTYYFIVVAFNDFGNTSSNCIGLAVAIRSGASTPDPIVKFLEDYWMLMVVIAAGIVVISIIVTSRRKRATRAKASQEQVPATKTAPISTAEPGIAFPQVAATATSASGARPVQQPVVLAAITAKFFCPSCVQYHDIVNPAMETWYNCPACGEMLQFVKICPHCNQSIALTREQYAYYKDKAIECWNCKNQVFLG